MSHESYSLYPRITQALALPGHHLRVRFDNDETRDYDFHPHLGLDMFHLLKSEAFFRAVRVDPGGYGLSWNDDMDIAASEIWLSGQPVESPCSALAD